MRVLVLGGTGAIGSHLCHMLDLGGREIVCTTRREHEASDGLTYVIGNAKDANFLDGLLSEHWDAIIDFMIWSTEEFRVRYQEFLVATDQYVFTSSYRVYAESSVIREDSPRLLDVVDDEKYLATDEYALCKARCEDLLLESGTLNWTIVRPAITYDGVSGRLQLGVFESGDWLWRAMNGVSVPIPREILDKQATMSYGVDVAEMIALLVGNPLALGETFTVSGCEHMTWREVVHSYGAVLPFEVAECAADALIDARGGEYQLRYDRMFDRVVDNSKVLHATGIDAGSLTKMREGLERELHTFLASMEEDSLLVSPGQQGRYDKLCSGMPALGSIAKRFGSVGTAKYLVRRWL